MYEVAKALETALCSEDCLFVPYYRNFSSLLLGLMACIAKRLPIL